MIIEELEMFTNQKNLWINAKMRDGANNTTVMKATSLDAFGEASISAEEFGAISSQDPSIGSEDHDHLRVFRLWGQSTGIAMFIDKREISMDALRQFLSSVMTSPETNFEAVLSVRPKGN